MAVSSGLVLLLLVVNLAGIQIGGSHYDANVGGTLADWAAAVGTVVAVPLAVFVGLRQVRTQDEALELSKQAAHADALARAEAAEADRARIEDDVQVRVSVRNVLDDLAYASEGERRAVTRWREEIRHRGWIADDDGTVWTRTGVTRTNAEQLSGERSPLLRDPWWISLSLCNESALTVVVERLTVAQGGQQIAATGPFEMPKGGVVTRRLGSSEGLPSAYSTTERANAVASGLSVVLDGCDILSRPIHIEYPGPA